MKRFRLKLGEPSEAEIQRAILQWLRIKRIFHWRQNTLGVFDQKTQRYRPSAMRGVSDILGILPGGKFLAIEVKSRTGKLSEYQEDFLDGIKSNGGLAICARSIGDVEQALSSYLRSE
jgi:hypothetical protein